MTDGSVRLDVLAPPRLGKVGVWSGALDSLSMSELVDQVCELESLGYGAIWFGDGIGRDSFVKASLILAATTTIATATGIASIWSRHPRVAQACTAALEDAFPGRFLLGLGTSHAHIVEGALKMNYEKPFSAMVRYLDGYDEAVVAAGRTARPSRVLAALGPRMLELSRDRAEGAHPYLVTPEHTAVARASIGPERLLCVEQAVVATEDRALALERGRIHLASYIASPNYRNNWLRLGFDESDFDDGGSERLVDALVASGSGDQIRSRIEAHFDAGADHVCIQVLGTSRADVAGDQWRAVAPALSF